MHDWHLQSPDERVGYIIRGTCLSQVELVIAPPKLIPD
jgi:hypothetical protein